MTNSYNAIVLDKDLHRLKTSNFNFFPFFVKQVVVIFSDIILTAKNEVSYTRLTLNTYSIAL